MSNECRGNRSSAATQMRPCVNSDRDGGLLIMLLSLRLMRTEEICWTALIKVTHHLPSLYFHLFPEHTVFTLFIRLAFFVLYVHPHPQPHFEAKGVILRSKAIHNLNCPLDAGFGRTFPQWKKQFDVQLHPIYLFLTT